jgi:hypothetical protein
MANKENVKSNKKANKKAKVKGMKTFNRKLKIGFPWFEVMIALPFFQVFTQFMVQHEPTGHLNFIVFAVEIFKWSFKFRVYKPDRTWLNAQNTQKMIFDGFIDRVQGLNYDDPKFMEEVKKWRNELIEVTAGKK